MRLVRAALEYPHRYSSSAEENRSLTLPCSNARHDSYSQSLPMAEDVLLVVEVSDTPLSFDLSTKIPLYARAAIPEAAGKR
jgi:hypothetical protein